MLHYRLHQRLFKSRIPEKVKKLIALLTWQGIWGHSSPHASKRKQGNDSSSVWREVVNDSLFLYDFNSWQKTGLLVASMADISLPSGPVMTEKGGEHGLCSVLKFQLLYGILVTVSEIHVNKPFCDSSLHLYCSLNTELIN